MSNSPNGWHRQNLGGIAMFDRLIESDTAGADFKSRSRYFLVSSLVVGLLFVSAVIFSIYAAEVGLGNEEFELSTVLAPNEPPEIKPEPPRSERQTSASQETSQVPVRIIKQQSIDQPPTGTPPVSVSPNRYLSLPPGLYEIGDRDSNVATAYGPPNDKPGSGSAPSSATQSTSTETNRTAETKNDPPPLVASKPKHIGIVNGKAVSLPVPPYPQIAARINLQGKVDVQVTIDENGRVVSAKAASGHMFLREAAENAAWKARFTPTILNGSAVKVTGVIVYNFTRN